MSPRGHLQEIAGCRLRTIVEPARVGVVRVLHAEPERGGIHLRHKGCNVARVPARQCVTEVVGRMHEEAFEELVLGQDLTNRYLCIGLVLHGVVLEVSEVGLGHRDAGAVVVVGAQRMVTENEIGRHHFGEAGDGHRLLRPGSHVDPNCRYGDGRLPGSGPRQRHGGRCRGHGDIRRHGCRHGGDRRGRVQPHRRPRTQPEQHDKAQQRHRQSAPASTSAMSLVAAATAVLLVRRARLVAHRPRSGTRRRGFVQPDRHRGARWRVRRGQLIESNSSGVINT